MDILQKTYFFSVVAYRILRQCCQEEKKITATLNTIMKIKETLFMNMQYHHVDVCICTVRIISLNTYFDTK